MSMDLTQDCPHCNASVGEMCEESCEANGGYVKLLKKALKNLGLYLDDNYWREIKSYSDSQEDISRYDNNPLRTHDEITRIF